MKNEGFIVGLFLFGERGTPAQAVSDAELTPESGLVGNQGNENEHLVSLMMIETIRSIDEGKGKPQGAPWTIHSNETGCNIITATIHLHGLIGKEFSMGDGVILQGVRSRNSSERPAEINERLDRDIEALLKYDDGIWARVIKGGRVIEGDEIVEISDDEIRKCGILTMENGQPTACGGRIEPVNVARPLTRQTIIGGPGEPPLFQYHRCSKCHAMYDFSNSE